FTNERRRKKVPISFICCFKNQITVFIGKSSVFFFGIFDWKHLFNSPYFNSMNSSGSFERTFISFYSCFHYKRLFPLRWSQRFFIFIFIIFFIIFRRKTIRT